MVKDNPGNFGGTWVVPTFNPGGDRYAGLGFALEAVALNELALKANQLGMLEKSVNSVDRSIKSLNLPA